MKLLNTRSQIGVGKFVRKLGCVGEYDEVIRKYGADNDQYKINELAIMTNEEYDQFKNNLVHDYDFLDGKGGIFTTTEPEGCEDKDYYELTEDQQAEWRRGAYRSCVGVTTPEAKELLVVDPQGFSYARYTAIIRN